MLDVSKGRSVSVGVVLCMFLAVVSAPVAAQAPPPDTRPLSAYELYRLYRDKTWLWDSGAAHFFDEGRRFVAWTADNSGLSHAAGRYELTDRGTMCLVGRWVGLDYGKGERYAVDERTCFSHVGAAGTVFQRRAPQGAWSMLAGPDMEEDMLIASDGGDVREKIVEIDETLEMLDRVNPVSPYQLLRLYGDRTWQWQSGGVHFFTEGRRFLAYTDDESEKAIGEGRFILTEDGRICLRGEWTGITLPETDRYTTDSTTCFRHLENVRGIYRLQAETMNWELVMSHTDSDMTAALIAEDTVTARVDALRSIIAR